MGGVGIRLRSNHFQITGITFTDLSGEQGHASALLCAASIDMRVEPPLVATKPLPVNPSFNIHHPLALWPILK